MIRHAFAGLLVLAPLASACASNDAKSDDDATSGTGGVSATGGVPGKGGTAGSVASGGTPSTGTGGTLPNSGGAGSSSVGGATAGGPPGTGGAAAGASSLGGSTPGGTGNQGGAAAGNPGGAGAGGAPLLGGAGGNAAGSGAGGSAGMPAIGDELPGSACTKQFTVPAFADLKTNAKMPDPFTFLDGSKVMTRDDWVCRQKEISQLAQAFIYGPKPPPPETLNASFSGNTLTLDMANAGKTWKLTVNIKMPTGDGPFPAMFDVDAGAPTGVAAIGTGLSWLTSNVASAGSGRGTTGKFYDFFPNSKKTGSLMAWAWVASRIIDGLIATKGQHNIDVTKTYGLGCSRNGKTAATIALFDQRVAMVAMQSPGSGTTSGWRIADAQTGSVQTADQIYDETTWMGEDFGQFGNAVDKLPIDQHEVLALAWPRPILVREGTNDSWNCPVCVYTTLKYTQLVYEALGSKDAVGFTHYNGGHCESGGTAWTNTYNAFIKHYILPADGTTATAGMFDEKFTFDKAKWQDGDLMPIP